MHPSELKNKALVAAAQARLDGFGATAESFLLLAAACAAEARDLQPSSSPATERRAPTASLGQMCVLEVPH